MTSSLDIKSPSMQIDGMIKTQIQLPEKQYQELREFAARREWSLAETFRRGAELLLEVYPPHPDNADRSWQPPVSETAEWVGLSPTELKEALYQDAEPLRKNLE